MRFAPRPVWPSLFLLSFALLIIIATPLHAALIHRWNFDEGSGTNVLDSVGTANGFISVVGGGMNPVDYSRGAGYVRLAGGSWNSTDFVRLPSGLIKSLTNVTIEIWATPNSAQNWSRIFDFGTNGAASTSSTASVANLSRFTTTNGIAKYFHW